MLFVMVNSLVLLKRVKLTSGKYFILKKDKNFDLEIINKALEQICKLADKYEIENVSRV